MNHYDASFLAIACALLTERPRRWWLAASIPVLAFALTLLPLGHFAPIVAALVACAPPLRPAVAALLLAVPHYPGARAAAVSAGLYLVGVAVLAALLEDRLDQDAVPAFLRGTPARLLVLAVAYFSLLPVAHL